MSGTSPSSPHSKDAEMSVIGMMLAKPIVCGTIIHTVLKADDFYVAGCRVLFEQIEENYIADDPIDPLVIAEAASKKLARLWDVDEREAVRKVEALASGHRQASEKRATDHAQVIKNHSNLRHLLDLADFIRRAVEAEEDDPDKIAADAGQRATEIATNSITTQEIVSLGELGRRYVKHLQRVRAAADQGVELGAKFGRAFIDDYTGGLQPTELLIAGGEPGVGKSAVWWDAGLGFAQSQANKATDNQIGTLILSLEMGEIPSSGRLAHTMTHLDGRKLREGTIDDTAMRKVVNEWGRRKDFPLYVNHTSTLKASQMRALIVEAIKRHNVGVVIIDHFRYFDMDQRYDNALREDEEKVRFLKEDLAKALNIAVICLAHTTKAIENQDKRPRLAHLRGSGQIAAHADFVNFIFRPWPYASQSAKDAGGVKETDAESIWAKNRHGRTGTCEFYADFDIMRIEDSI